MTPARWALLSLALGVSLVLAYAVGVEHGTRWAQEAWIWGCAEPVDDGEVWG